MLAVNHNTPAAPAEALQLKGTDYIEMYVGNAHQAAHFYRTTFGFTPVAYAGPETGVPDRVSFLIVQGDIRLILTSPIETDHPIAEHIKIHGDGVKDIAFTVDNAVAAFEHALRAGARPISEPLTFEGPNGRFTSASIGVYGDTIHSFIQRESSDHTYFPKFRTLKNVPAGISTGLIAVDHVAVCVEPGTLDRWVEFYQEVLGFHQLHEEKVETEYSAMNSKAVQDASGQIKFPMMEPAPSKRKSQIEEYLAAYNGAGVQHIAVLSDDIVATVRALRANGIEFRHTPGTYFDVLLDRVGSIDVDLAALREQHILVDRDPWGYLMQIFAKPVQSRPTLFCEIIQRAGARGFGSGNIKALFESIEREQKLRGVL